MMSHFLVQVFQDIALIHEVKVAVMSDLFDPGGGVGLSLFKKGLK